MNIQNLAEDLILVTLPDGPQREGALISLNKLIARNANCDVIIDFSNVDILTSADMGRLVKLHNYLGEYNRKLTLCNVAFNTRCIFTAVGLDRVLNFADDKEAALEAINHND